MHLNIYILLKIIVFGFKKVKDVFYNYSRNDLKNFSNSSSSIGSGVVKTLFSIIFVDKASYSLASLDSGYFSTTVFASNSLS